MNYLNASQIARITYEPGTDLICATSGGEWVTFTGEDNDKLALLQQLTGPGAGWVKLPESLDIALREQIFGVRGGNT